MKEIFRWDKGREQRRGGQKGGSQIGEKGVCECVCVYVCVCWVGGGASTEQMRPVKCLKLHNKAKKWNNTASQLA